MTVKATAAKPASKPLNASNKKGKEAKAQLHAATEVKVSAPRAAKKNQPKAGPSDGDLHAKLIAAAARCVEDYGVAGVRARDVAAYAGCSPGLIYYAFPDLDGLIIALNHETRNRLHQALGQVLGDDPRDNLDRLAIGYLNFAHENKQLWRALFEFRVRNGKTVPEDFRQDIMATFFRITDMLRAIFPLRKTEEMELVSRALFSAVHGIVALGLDEHYVAVPMPKLEEEICRFIAIFMKGLEATKIA